MRSRLLYWIPSLLLATLCLVPANIVASPTASRPQPMHRSLFLSDEPKDSAPEIRVAARTSTTLRFEIPPSPSLTKLGGWEARFEPPLVGGSSVVVVALHELSPKDRVPLTVTLMDGTVLPFTLVAAQEMVDAQVDVFLDTESVRALKRALEDEREENNRLQAENLRHQQEALSTEHALATLVLNKAFGEHALTTRQRWTLKSPGIGTDIEADIDLLLLPEKIVPGYVAALFTITNKSREQAWTLGEVRLTNMATGEIKPYAVRMHSTRIAPGQTGHLVIVTSLLNPEGSGSFLLEVFRKNGLRDFAFIDLKL
ncbi:MAG TPA: DUF2381 family protein [Archangium sp.]|nr:DUF2381 family protein [Archangium sp.]